MQKNVESFLHDMRYQKLWGALWCYATFISNDMRNGTTWKDWSESIAMLPPFGPIKGHKWFFQISSQWEPCGDTSNAATVDVRTRVVSLASLLMETKRNIFLKISSEIPRVIRATVATFDVSPLSLWLNITTRFWVFSCAHHVKRTPRFFGPKRWNRFFAI